MPNYFKSRSLMSLAVGVTVAVTAVGGVAYAMRPATPPTDPALSVSQDQRSAMLTPTPGDPASADLKQWIPRVSQSEVYGDSRDTSQPLVVPLEEVQIPAVQAAEVASVTPPVTTQSQPAQPTVQRDDDEYSESSEHSERESDDDHEDDSDEYGESDSDDEDEAEGWDD
jgi:hypothetical protein